MNDLTNHPAPDPLEPGQESVWDYPRPPRLEICTEHIEVYLGGVRIASTSQSWRVLETSHPPNFYLPHSAFLTGALVATTGSTWCEWKGRASYFDVIGGESVAQRAAWTYRQPVATYGAIAGAIAVMPGTMERCLVNGELVRAQSSGFYGGWITDQIVGPFKGGPGTNGW